jgi:hypothetical protein
MTSDSMLPPDRRPSSGPAGLDTVKALLASPLVQWALLILVMLVLLAVTRSSVAESPYNNF